MAINYSKVNWQDYPNSNTPMVARNFNQMDDGIKAACDQVDKLSTIVQVLVPAAGWTSSAPYTNTVLSEAASAESAWRKIGVDFPANNTNTQNIVLMEAGAMINDGEAQAGQFVFKCFKDKPAVDLTLILMRVS